jgi:hypothetical protein
MNLKIIYEAAIALGHAEPISIESDGTIWLGLDAERVYLTEAEQKAVTKKASTIEADKAAARQAVLDKLGLTANEAQALLG